MIRVIGALVLLAVGFLAGMAFHEFRIRRWTRRSFDLRNRTMYSLREL